MDISRHTKHFFSVKHRHNSRHFLNILIAASLLVSVNAQAVTTPSTFIKHFLPVIKQANHRVLASRERLMHLYAIQKSHGRLNLPDRVFLNELAVRYEVQDFQLNNKVAWLELLKRVDIVPEKLMLAQAINESNWGRSQFAKKANNYFGQWCFQPGCGLIPRHRPAGSHYEVQRFNSPGSSAYAYLLNINTNPHYARLRDLRRQERLSGKPLSSISLATGLSRYSSERGVYVKKIQNIIQQHL